MAESLHELQGSEKDHQLVVAGESPGLGHDRSFTYAGINSCNGTR